MVDNDNNTRIDAVLIIYFKPLNGDIFKQIKKIIFISSKDNNKVEADLKKKILVSVYYFQISDL